MESRAFHATKIGKHSLRLDRNDLVTGVVIFLQISADIYFKPFCVRKWFNALVDTAKGVTLKNSKIRKA